MPQASTATSRNRNEKKRKKKGDSLAVPWLGLCEDLGSISG